MSGKKEKKYKESDVMVLLESMNNGIEIIAESQQQLRNDVKSLDGKVSSLDGKVTSLDDKVNSLDDKVNSIDKKVNSLEKELKNGMANVQAELSEIKFKLDRKVSYDDFEKLEKRVLKLENASV